MAGWSNPNTPAPHPQLGAQEDSQAVVGGCNGIHVIPASGLADYYRAHSLIACCAIMLLAVAIFGTLMF